eukprot:350098-Chlamydomonas_euryale.AAC.2
MCFAGEDDGDACHALRHTPHLAAFGVKLDCRSSVQVSPPAAADRVRVTRLCTHDVCKGVRRCAMRERVTVGAYKAPTRFWDASVKRIDAREPTQWSRKRQMQGNPHSGHERDGRACRARVKVTNSRPDWVMRCVLQGTPKNPARDVKRRGHFWPSVAAHWLRSRRRSSKDVLPVSNPSARETR